MSDEARETTEATPFDPLPAFAWGVAHCRLVLEARGIDPIVIHPAMVYEPCGGVFARFRRMQPGAMRCGWSRASKCIGRCPRRGPRHPVSVGAGRKRSPGKLHRRRNRRHAGGPHRPGICATVRHALRTPKSFPRTRSPRSWVNGREATRCINGKAAEKRAGGWAGDRCTSIRKARFSPSRDLSSRPPGFLGRLDGRAADDPRARSARRRSSAVPKACILPHPPAPRRAPRSRSC